MKVHDTLLVYAKEYGQHTYNKQFTAYQDKYVRDWFRHDDGDGRKYRTRTRKGKIVKQYLDQSPGVPLSTCWSDVKQIYGQQGWFPGEQKEQTGYPTQKPLALLERVIKASSNEGDVVLDPFCGCATALVAAESLGRQWAGIDLSDMAAKLVVQRLEQASDTLWGGKIHHRGDVPRRTDQGKLPDYRTHKHTLYGKQEGVCGGCRTHFPFRNLTIDHIVPRDRGGSDHADNLQLLCGACNSVKGNRDQAYLVARLREHGVLA